MFPNVFSVLRPEYFWRPSQIARRLRLQLRPATAADARCPTPWGLEVLAAKGELHGRALHTLGVVDLRVSELIWRLMEPGDHAVDVGANIGAMTSLMARRAGSAGKVYAFEPHPETATLLERSVRLWAEHANCAEVKVLRIALSSAAGEGFLEEPSGFDTNSGLARLSSRPAERGFKVATTTFDQFFQCNRAFKVVKIDVEGHEDSVFAGMATTLSKGLIDHIVFEEFRPVPNDLTRSLDDFDYSCYLIERDFMRLRLIPVEKRPERVRGEPTNIVATRDPSFLAAVTRPRGWKCLRG